MPQGNNEVEKGKALPIGCSTGKINSYTQAASVIVTEVDFKTPANQ